MYLQLHREVIEYELLLFVCDYKGMKQKKEVLESCIMYSTEYS